MSLNKLIALAVSMAILLVAAVDGSLRFQANASASDNETAISELAAVRLSKLPLLRQKPARALLLCQELSPELSCGWFSVDKRNGSVHSMACFDETSRVCNTKSSKWERNFHGKFTINCDTCEPCARVAQCTQCKLVCLCSCARRAGQPLLLDSSSNQWDTFECNTLCNGKSDCPTSDSDEAPALCNPYLDKIPFMQWYHWLFIGLFCALVLCVVFLKTMDYLSDSTKAAAAAAASTVADAPNENSLLADSPNATPVAAAESEAMQLPPPPSYQVAVAATEA